MKKGIIAAVLLLMVGVIFGGIVYGTYTGLVGKRNAVTLKAWPDVGAAEQRRLDTVPKFAKNAQFSADFQLKLQGKYVQGREGVKNAAATGNPEILQKAANDAYSALVIAVRAEAVPQAKLDQLTELNAQIENTERVINHERKIFNDTVATYMTARQNPIAAAFISWFGWGETFPPLEPFKAQPGAEKSPDYDLNLK